MSLARAALALWMAAWVAACDVTGTAAPSGAAADTGKTTQYLGEPGSRAP